MANSTVYTECIPNHARLRALTAALLSRAELSAAELVAEFGDLAVCEQIANARDAFAVAATAAKAETEAGDLRTADADLERLQQSVTGRDRAERLLTLHLAAGFAADSLRTLIQWRADVEGGRDEQQFELLELTAPMNELVGALSSLFADDTILDDRLAMWGRRIAGDCAVWARTLLGLSTAEAAGEAEDTVEQLLSTSFAEHSRRMNVLKLAA